MNETRLEKLESENKELRLSIEEKTKNEIHVKNEIKKVSFLMKLLIFLIVVGEILYWVKLE